MGLIWPGGEKLLDFLELRQVLSTYDGDLRDPSGGLRKGLSPCEFLGGLSAYSRVESGMLGNFLSCNKGVKEPLEVPEVRCV